jgi:hypothetical protein
MNLRMFTGYLPADCDEAWAPATANRPNEPRLVFDVILKDSTGQEFPEKCFVDDVALVKVAKPLLTAGRAIIVQGEQTARPFNKSGVQMGWIREVRVQRIEFPNRSGAKKAEGEMGRQGEGEKAA